jgi:cytochrome c biogenesis protein CcmG/thiol:disulfide interchange protein DsbE
MIEPRQNVLAAQAASAWTEDGEEYLRSGSPLAQPGKEDSGYSSRCGSRAGPRRVASCRLVGSRALFSALLAVALLCVGCGAQPRSAAPSRGAAADAFRGSPPSLVSLHVQADQLLPGGPAGFQARLRSLRGYPVVVNKWASWCGPCQTEFPAFQQAAVSYGRRVAFIGLDGKDADGSAASFLHRFPVTYPSYVDPQEAIARAIQAATYYPQTLYFDRQGHEVYDHAGAYPSAAALKRDILLYLLGAKS